MILVDMIMTKRVRKSEREAPVNPFVEVVT